MCHHLRTSLQALVDVLLEHPQACWIPWSAGRGASEKPFWNLRQTKGEFSTLPCSAFPGAREVGEAPPLEIFRTQRDESWSGSGATEIQHGNVAFPLVRCFCVHESQRLFSLKHQMLLVSGFTSRFSWVMSGDLETCPVQYGGVCLAFLQRTMKHVVLHSSLEGLLPSSSLAAGARP